LVEKGSWGGGGWGGGCSSYYSQRHRETIRWEQGERFLAVLGKYGERTFSNRQTPPTIYVPNKISKGIKAEREIISRGRGLHIGKLLLGPIW